MSIHHLIRLALAACLLCAGMARAQAQVMAQPQTVPVAWNQRQPIALQAADATPGGPYAITYAIAILPTHGAFFGNSFNAQTGTLIYEPADDYQGPDSFTFTASTANGTSAPATVSITVAGPRPPLAYDKHFDVPFNTTRDLHLAYDSVNLSETQPNYAPVFEFVTPPAHGSAVFHANSATYTPATGYAGPDSFTYRIVGQFGISNTATASISVAAAGLPVALPGSSFVPHGTATAIALAARDDNPGGPYALTYALAEPPAHGSVSVSGSTATYTPANGYWGEDSFTFTTTSANGTSAPAAVRVLVGQPVVLGVAGARGDTGQTRCTDTAGTSIACAALSSHPGQDGRYGRDAQKGAPAFDYLAIAGGCVQDRVTGLTWSADTLAGTTWAAANATAASYSRCGIASGWRLPTRRELLSIVHHGASGPAIDSGAFPATQSAPYWSSDANAAGAWAVDFSDGDTRRIAPAEAHAARLVAQPVNQPPTITLGAAEIVIGNDQRPRPYTFPGWATGISPGPAREAGQQLFASVRLLPVPGVKTLEFDVPPAIDPATGDLTFTVRHHIYPAGQLPAYDNPQNPSDPGTLRDVFYWTSSAGRVQVEVTLQDDGGTVGGGVDTTVKSFDIFISPVPRAIDINIKHPWKAACVPVSMLAIDIDTDPTVNVTYPQRYAPLFRIKEYPHNGFITDDASVIGKSISVPLGDTVDSVPDHVGMTGLRSGVAGDSSYPYGTFPATVCWVPKSSTFLGFDTFSYTVVDVDGNESEPASVTIETYEVN